MEGEPTCWIRLTATKATYRALYASTISAGIRPRSLSSYPLARAQAQMLALSCPACAAPDFPAVRALRAAPTYGASVFSNFAEFLGERSIS